MSSKNRLHVLLAQEAARLIIEEGMHDYAAAWRKAAHRQGLGHFHELPRYEDIEAALAEYHRLYRPREQSEHIARLRALAVEAMQFLAEFSPMLTGGVWDGSAGPFSPITLHLFPPTAEEVMHKLLNAGIPFEESIHPLNPGRALGFPALKFMVDDVPVALLLFPPEWKRKKYRSPGGDLAALRTLMAQAVEPV